MSSSPECRKCGDYIHHGPVICSRCDSGETDRVEQWQPIETAPRDGEWLLLHGDGSGFRQCPYIGYWGTMNTDEPLKFGSVPAWRRTFGGDITDPTHWMPLPDPPENVD